MVVEVCYGGEGGPYEVRGIRFVVVTFAADAVEKLSTEGKVSY